MASGWPGYSTRRRLTLACRSRPRVAILRDAAEAGISVLDCRHPRRATGRLI